MTLPRLVGVSVLVSGLATIAATAEPAQDAVSTLVRVTKGPLLEVSLLLAELQWAPRADVFVKGFPGSETLGAAWSPESTHYQNGRQAVLRRVNRISELYRKAGPLEDKLREQLAKMPSAQATTIATALGGPAGPAILRAEMQLLFSVSAFEVENQKLQVPSPEYFKRAAELNRLFNERIPSSVLPPDDHSHDAELKVWLGSPVQQSFTNTLQLAEALSRNALETQITLLINDDLEAIGKEIAAALAAAKKGR